MAHKINQQLSQNDAQFKQAQQQLVQEQEQNKNLREKIKAMSDAHVAEINKSAKLEDTEMKLEHKTNTQIVKKSDDLDLMVANKELNPKEEVVEEPVV